MQIKESLGVENVRRRRIIQATTLQVSHMNYAAIILKCPLCSNKIGVDFIGEKCPNPECLYKFGKKKLEMKDKSGANEKRVLRAMRRVYTDSTLKASQLRKEFDLTEEEILDLAPDYQYGDPRYFREHVALYLRNKQKKPKQKQLSLM